MHATRAAADAPTRTGAAGPSAALLLIADSRLPAGGHAHSGGAEEAVRIGAIAAPEDLARFLRGRLATAGLVAAALAAASCHLAATLAARPGPPGRAAPRRSGPEAHGAPARPATARHLSAEAAATPRTPAPGPDTTPDPHGSGPAVPVAPDGGAADEASPWRELDAEADARTASPAQRAASRTQGRLLLRTARRIWPSAVLDGLAAAIPDGAHHPVALGAACASAGCSVREAALAAAYNSVTGPATAAVRLLGLDPVTVHRLLADLAPDLDGTAAAAVAAVDACVRGATGSPDSPRPDAAAGRAPDPGPASNTGTDPGPARDDGHGAPPHRTRYDWAALPSWGAPALDLLAEGHLRREVRLFVS